MVRGKAAVAMGNVGAGPHFLYLRAASGSANDGTTGHRLMDRNRQRKKPVWHVSDGQPHQAPLRFLKQRHI